MSEDESSLGTPEEVAEAREKLAAIQDSNAYAAMQILMAIEKRLAVDSATLMAVCEAAPHLFTRFLMKEASASLDQAVRILVAAMELLPIDEGEVAKGGLILPEPPKAEPDSESGTGQYL
jgi:hypothetical protein